jgi:hypothetical protein
MSSMPNHNSFNDIHRAQAEMFAAMEADDGYFDPSKVVTSNLEVALNYARAGISIFPCKNAPGEPGVDKSPLGIRSWTAESTTKENTIRAWWRKYPYALIGIDCGKSGLVVIDADRHERCPDGVAAFDDLVDANGGIEYGPITLTAGNGHHHFFLQPTDGEPLGNGEGALKGRGINVRGVGGYVIGQGSMREDIEIDGWRLGGYPSPGLAEAYAAGTIPIIPHWLVDLIRAPKQDDEEPEPQESASETESDTGKPEQPQAARPAPAPSARTSDGGERAWAKVALEKRTARLADTGEGGRNNALNAVAYSLGRIVARGWIAESDCRAALEDACKQNGVWKDDGPKQCRATINSGLRKGKLNPRPDLPEREDDREAEIWRGLEEYEEKPEILESDDGTLYDAETGEVVKLAKSPTSAVNNELPEHLTRPVGVLGDIVNWVTDSAINPSRVLSLGSAISVVGTIIGRRVAGPTKSGTHQYIIALAESGAGKDHPLRRAAAQLIAVNPGLVGPGDFTSQNAFIQHVSVAPLSMCPMDELGVFVARACDKKGTSWERGMTKVLREYWGASFETVQGTQWADRKSEPVEWPALSLFGVSTHEEFFGALSSKEVTNGFLNRFLMLSTVADTIDVDEPIASKSKIPEDIVRTLAELYADCMGGDPASSAMIDERVAQRLNEDRQIEIGWADDQVFDEYRELRKRARAKRKTSTVGEVYSRTAEIAVRLATVHAVSRAGLDAKVNSADLAWGRELAMWSADTMAREASLRMADSPAQKNAKLVLLKITEAGGTIKHRELHRALRYELNPTGFKEATTMLVESGAIQIVKVKPPKGGREVVTYTLAKEGEA